MQNNKKMEMWLAPVKGANIMTPVYVKVGTRYGSLTLKSIGALLSCGFSGRGYGDSTPALNPGVQGFLLQWIFWGFQLNPKPYTLNNPKPLTLKP